MEAAVRRDHLRRKRTWTGRGRCARTCPEAHPVYRLWTAPERIGCAGPTGGQVAGHALEASGAQAGVPGTHIVRSSCPAHTCGGRCVLTLHVRDGVIVRIETDERPTDTLESPQLRACARGRAHRKRQYHPDRLPHPLKRVGARRRAFRHARTGRSTSGASTSSGSASAPTAACSRWPIPPWQARRRSSSRSATRRGRFGAPLAKALRDDRRG